jgi:O-antigen ligase
MGNAMIYGDIEERYIGTSSSQITYAYLIITLLILIINYTSTYRESPKNFILSLLMITGLIWVWTLTGTKGPLITLLLCLPVIFYYKKMILLPVIVLALTSSLIYVNNDFYQRFDALYDSILQTSVGNEDLSYLERKAYLRYGVHMIRNSPFLGIGPGNVENKMADYFKDKSIDIVAQDHLHNDYIDMSAKFGLPSLIFLILIYFSLYKKIIVNSQSTSILLLIILISSQLTQSQFAHHQIISFLISMIFVTLNTRNYDVKSKEDRKLKR